MEEFEHSRATQKIHHGWLEAHMLALSTVRRKQSKLLVAEEEEQKLPSVCFVDSTLMLESD